VTRLLLFWDSIRSSYWFVPGLLTMAALVLANVFIDLDERLTVETLRQMKWVYSGGAEGARAALSVIGGSVITVAATTFSITIAVLSLASGQYGPRVLGSFMRDRGSQIVMGVFTATFLYCLLVLRVIRSAEENLFVPHLAVTFAFLLALTSVFVLIFFIHHVARSIQPAKIIESLGRQLDETVERLFPESAGEELEHNGAPESRPHILRSEREGYVAAVDAKKLLHKTQEADGLVRLSVRPGDYILPDGKLAQVWAEDNDALAEAAREAFSIAPERTTQQDAEFAFMQLAEMAVRALSPGINDPYTASVCVDRMAGAIAKLGKRHLPASHRADEEGRLRLIAPVYSYEDLVGAAFRPVLHHGRESPIILERLREQALRLADIVERDGLRRVLEEIAQEAERALAVLQEMPGKPLETPTKKTGS
jgi:uncharacterized membrane protein